MHLLVVTRQDGKPSVHIADTDRQLLNAIFKGNVPDGMTLEHIKHMEGAALLSVERIHVHDAKGDYDLVSN